MNKSGIKKAVYVFTFLVSFFFPVAPLAAQEELMVTSHTINLQQYSDEKPRYEVVEEITIKNNSATVFKDKLVFFVDLGAEEISVVGFKDQEKIDRVRLDAKPHEEHKELVVAPLAEEVSIKPKGGTTMMEIKYSFPLSKENQSIWKTKILYPHAAESLKIRANPVENLGYRLETRDFEPIPDQEGGWYTSPMLSPQRGNTYALAMVKEGEGVAFSLKEELIDLPLSKINQAISDNLTVAFLVNDLLALLIVFLLPRLVKRLRFPRPKIRLPRIKLQITMSNPNQKS